MNASSLRAGTHPDSALLSRREALRQLSAGTLLALGLWPGTLRADNDVPAGSFRFVVINDTHAASLECGDYFRGVVSQIRKEEIEFILHAGDVTDTGHPEYFGMMKELFEPLPSEFHPVIGNHDYVTDSDRAFYTQAFPRRLNYHFTHGGWQFLGLDTTQGQRADHTTIHAETLNWLDGALPKLNRRKPTAIFTHFPLGLGVQYRPLNADALLDRFREFNLQAVFSGHYHAFTERVNAGVVLTTNRCCSLKRNNHDGTKEKGYFLCCAQEGKLLRSFVEHRT